MRGGMCRTSHAAIGAATSPPASRPATQVGSMPWEPSANRKPRLAATATRNSEVSIEPITLRGSMRPLARIAGVPTGPQPPPPVASTKPATRPERPEEALAHRLAEVAAVDAAQGEADQQVDAEPRAGSATSPGRRARWRGSPGTSRRRRRRPHRGRRSWRRPSSRRCRTSSAPGPDIRRRADLREVDGRRRRGRVGADGQQQRGRRDAVGHAQAAVDAVGRPGRRGRAGRGSSRNGTPELGTAGAQRRSAAGRTRGAVRRGGQRPGQRLAQTRSRSTWMPPHEEHRRRRHAAYVYQFDRHMQRAVPHGGIRPLGRTSLRMVSHETTPPAANSAAHTIMAIRKPLVNAAGSA